MATLSVRFPNSVHEAVKAYAKEDDISINQFITSAVIEKLTSLDTVNYLEERSLRGSEEKYLKVLKKAPHAKPREDDAIE
ncbi:MAG: toxin-antitoxin system HicB family antitoxin [Lachnospiraceae bacterium]|nr:toxin-antitoxin system HicB family antitoxin [Lachnospiraceae bacterium]